MFWQNRDCESGRRVGIRLLFVLKRQKYGKIHPKNGISWEMCNV